jgi:hypothetical protein
MVMSFNVERRNGMIERLIEDDMNTIHESGDPVYLYSLLYSGFKGYESYTDDELMQEMNERDLWDNWFKDTE